MVGGSARNFNTCQVFYSIKFKKILKLITALYGFSRASLNCSGDLELQRKLVKNAEKKRVRGCLYRPPDPNFFYILATLLKILFLFYNMSIINASP